ncbi:MAG: chemotaxis protein CheW [Rubrivivax sp.]|jgi:purine-binding chemotaxis protein CheW|nr:chemotaxis protein CheW [Rubrivivax sp.]
MEMIAESAQSTRAVSPQTRNPSPAPATGPSHRGATGRATAAAPKAVRHGEFLTFRLGGEEYGIDILRVQEIRSYEPPTRIANAPAFLKGVVNLRGVIVPILDLRLKLGCDSAEYNGFTVVIVLNVHDRVVGVVVDSVSDVIELQGDQVKEAPRLNSNVDAGFITGIGAVKNGDAERMLILVDIQALMGSADMGLVDSVC